VILFSKKNRCIILYTLQWFVVFSTSSGWCFYSDVTVRTWAIWDLQQMMILLWLFIFVKAGNGSCEDNGDRMWNWQSEGRFLNKSLYEWGRGLLLRRLHNSLLCWSIGPTAKRRNHAVTLANRITSKFAEYQLFRVGSMILTVRTIEITACTVAQAVV